MNRKNSARTIRLMAKTFLLKIDHTSIMFFNARSKNNNNNNVLVKLLLLKNFACNNEGTKDNSYDKTFCEFFEATRKKHALHGCIIINFLFQGVTYLFSMHNALKFFGYRFSRFEINFWYFLYLYFCLVVCLSFILTLKVILRHYHEK